MSGIFAITLVFSREMVFCIAEIIINIPQQTISDTIKSFTKNPKICEIGKELMILAKNPKICEICKTFKPYLYNIWNLGKDSKDVVYGDPELAISE